MGVFSRHRPRHAKTTVEDLIPGASRREIVEAFITAAGTDDDRLWVQARQGGALDADEQARYDAYLDAIADRLDGVTAVLPGIP